MDLRTSESALLFDVLISLLLSFCLFFNWLKNKMSTVRHRKYYQNDTKILYVISNGATEIKLRFSNHILKELKTKNSKVVKNVLLLLSLLAFLTFHLVIFTETLTWDLYLDTVSEWGYFIPQDGGLGQINREKSEQVPKYEINKSALKILTGVSVSSLPSGYLCFGLIVLWVCLTKGRGDYPGAAWLAALTHLQSICSSLQSLSSSLIPIWSVYHIRLRVGLYQNWSSLWYQHVQHTCHRELPELQSVVFSVPSVHTSPDNISGKWDGAWLPWMATTHGEASGCLSAFLLPPVLKFLTANIWSFSHKKKISSHHLHF